MGCSTGSSRWASSCSRCAGCRRPTAPRSPPTGDPGRRAPPRTAAPGGRAPAGTRAHARLAHRRAPLPPRARQGGVRSVSSAAPAVRSSVPPLPAATVERPRLLAALDACRAGGLTLVGAPPGWGKTVLLSGWAGEHDAAWLTLGPRHADPQRLWSDVCEALGLDDLGPDGDDLPLRVADALTGATQRATLVL